MGDTILSGANAVHKAIRENALPSVILAGSFVRDALRGQFFNQSNEATLRDLEFVAKAHRCVAWYDPECDEFVVERR